MSRLITRQGVSRGVREGRTVNRAAVLFPYRNQRWTRVLALTALALWLVLLGGMDDAGRMFTARACAGAPQYVYDDAGRLIAVIDSTGDTAVYTYDAVGNLLSITRQPSSTLSILNFTPKSGPIGTVVTIYGTGFSTTLSQNTVTFNGAAATVTSATTTQLVTAVPGGATSGPIAVTTPAGSTTSTASFTVTNAGAPGAPPTITSFTPTIGVPGTSVTITGANFSPTPADNQVLFTATQANITASTTTTITTSVSSVRASGHITVATPSGAAVSADDFFIPPGSYTVTDVGTTGRMTIGQSQLISIASNKIALIVFDGTASQRVSIRTTGATMGSISLAVRDPYGTLLINAGLGGPDGFIDPLTLLVTGSYTITIDPSGSAAGSVTVILHDLPADVSGTITPGGAAVSVTTTVPGQNALLNFEGTAGQQVRQFPVRREEGEKRASEGGCKRQDQGTRTVVTAGGRVSAPRVPCRAGVLL